MDIEAKLTPLFVKISLFCNVAPRKESITLPKKPKKTVIIGNATNNEIRNELMYQKLIFFITII